MYTFNLTLKRPKKQLLLKQNLSLFKATNPITHQNQNHFGTYQYDYQLEWVPMCTWKNIGMIHAHIVFAGPTSESRRALRD